MSQRKVETDEAHQAAECASDAAIIDAQLKDATARLERLNGQSGADKIFLIGAGCSVCAGLPSMEKLTSQVVDDDDDGLSSTTKGILEEVKKNFPEWRNPNIEDYLSELVDYLSIVERRLKKGDEEAEGDEEADLDVNYNEVLISKDGLHPMDDLRKAIDEIKDTISKIIGNPEGGIEIETHRKFIRAVHVPMRPGKSNYTVCTDYICLNYDTLLEDALALEKVSYSDGIDGGATGWWNPKMFERKDISSRIFKPHGSIDWCELDDDPFPRRFAGNTQSGYEGEKRILIWPASTKYREIQMNPYAQLMEYVRKVLIADVGSQKILYICGYGFKDSHINAEIDNALRQSDGRLTVVAFTSDHEPIGQLGKWYKSHEVRNRVLIFAKGGFFHGDTKVLSGSRDLSWWKFEELTKLLGGGK